MSRLGAWMEKRLDWVPKIMWVVLIGYVASIVGLTWNYNHNTSKALGDSVRACRCVCEAP